MLFKVGYVVTRQSGLFSLPVLRRIRNYFYCDHLKTADVNVDDFVRIGPAHRTSEMKLKVGTGLRVGRNAELDSSGGLFIGDRVTVSEDAKIYTHDHVINGGLTDWRKNGPKTSPLVIEQDAWIGAGAIVLSSVSRIGRGAVIAAGSIVRHDVPDLTIVAGNPARVVKSRHVVDEAFECEPVTARKST
jgi:acetyltransferase-like isoleucine patch superfamily enzyme